MDTTLPWLTKDGIPVEQAEAIKAFEVYRSQMGKDDTAKKMGWEINYHLPGPHNDEWDFWNWIDDNFEWAQVMSEGE